MHLQSFPCWEVPAPAPAHAAPLALGLGLGSSSPRLAPAYLSPTCPQAAQPLHPSPQASWDRQAASGSADWLSHGQWRGCCWVGRGSLGLSSQSCLPTPQLAPQPAAALGLRRDSLQEGPFHLELFSQQRKVFAELCRPSVRSRGLGLLTEGGKGKQVEGEGT